MAPASLTGEEADAEEAKAVAVGSMDRPYLRRLLFD